MRRGKTPESSHFLPFSLWGHREKTITACKSGKGPSQRTEYAGTSILVFLSCRTKTNRCLLLKPFSLWCFVKTARADKSITKALIYNHTLPQHLKYWSSRVQQVPVLMSSTSSCWFPWNKLSSFFERLNQVKDITHTLGWTQETLFICYQVGILCSEGSGTPLQYSCLENPMDGGAW